MRNFPRQVILPVVAAAVVLAGGATAIGAVASASRDVATASVRLELRPRVAHPGAWVKLVIVNGTPRLLAWGGCFAWQRWAEGHWQGTPGTCLAFVPFRPHSETTRVVHLADDFRPGRYRINFIYKDSPATARQPELVAYADLTVVPPIVRPARGMGVLTGAIRFVGGPSTVKPRPPSAGEVIVASLTTLRVVVREHVLAGHYFRLRLPPGGYELRASAHPDCSATEAIVYPSHTTRADVDFGCSIP